MWLRLRHRDDDAFIRGNYRLQWWWASQLKRAADSIFSIRYQITGQEALPGSAILASRHASLADTVLPVTIYAKPQQLRLRYIMKRELLWDPCLDIVGNRLPNFFIARGTGEQAQIDGVVSLLEGLEPMAGVLIYPEGTRFTVQKREQLLERFADDPRRLAQMERWPDLLPPRLGGLLAMLEHNPGLDVLFCAHVGFEGSTSFGSLVNGSWVGTRVQVHFWRVPYAQLPAGRAALEKFLFEQWDVMQETIARMKASAATPDHA